ncbi:hypothetical protein ANTQUA_LOCUS9394 [Anthophora quadrimaculata]
MRALNPRRPQLTSTFCLVPRFFLCLLFLLLVLHAGQPRSIVHDEEGKISTVEKNGELKEEVQGKLGNVQIRDHDIEDEKLVSEESDNVGEKIVPQTMVEARSNNQEEEVSRQGANKEEVKKIDVAEEVVGVSDEGSEEASVAKKRRRNDVALVGKSETPLENVGEAKDEGIRRFDVRVDADGGVAVEKGESESVIDAKKSEVFDAEEARIQQAEESKEVHADYFRKSGKIEDEEKNEEEIASNENSESKEEYVADREYRSFAEADGKSKRKSSTVYLSAEEKKISDGEQQSIVEGQIKKLISIRDDALGSQTTDKIDEAKVLSAEREIAMDEVAFAQQEVQNERLNKVKSIKLTNNSVLGKWKDQAVSLQEKIKDRTFLLHLKEMQAIDILPGIPKFSDNQLLVTLEQIVLQKRLQPLSISYANNLKDLGLTEVQLRIVRCAEQLLAVQQRQSFVENLTECIRGLSILNCMRIFVWPIIVENIPQSISQNLGNFPIEINVFDLFQGNRQKSGRSHDLHQFRLLTPNSVVYNILQDALETYPNDDTLISYIDPKNETLKTLLSSDQMNILQMAEKFLPQPLRREYSDQMFSCVRRFEYYSCVKYFAWPLIKQYFPALPAFPDYQSWYPIIDLSPQYPIFPFPSFSEDIGELPEVVDADATRSRKPRPEAIIIQVLQNTLKEHPRISTTPSYFDQLTDTYVTLIPEDQLLSLNMAEQLIPISFRLEFVQNIVRCMKEYNYLTCFKNSAWPSVRRFVPTLPDISSFLPDFQTSLLPNFNTYIPEFPEYTDTGYYWPIIGGPSIHKETNIPTYYSLKTAENLLQTSNELEAKILEILQKIEKTETYAPVAYGGPKSFTITNRQVDIIRLAERAIPSSARPNFINGSFAYLNKHNNFIDYARYVIWPTVSKYVPSLPEFPQLIATNERFDPNAFETKEGTSSSREVVQERIIPDVQKGKNPLPDKESRNRVPNGPVISVTGTRFVPIFTEHPEAVILNILRALQLQSLKTNVASSSSITRNQQFLDLLTDQQVNIIRIVDVLLPENIRPEFANKMIDCLRVNNFLICTRDIAWPTLQGIFPWLPTFPNFGVISNPTGGSPSSPPSGQNLTEPSSSSNSPPLSETDVKTGQHGDTTVTITDTRFFPIFNDLPETIILNILKAVQLSTPNLPGSPVPTRTQDFSSYLSEQQINIIHIAENLLPIPFRADYISRIVPCTKERNFLECTRDITWPIVAQSYPWLPSFPSFGSLESLPGVSGSSSIRFQVFLSEKPSTPTLENQASQKNFQQKTEALIMKEMEDKIESILLNFLRKSPEVEKSYLNVTDTVASKLTTQELTIIRLIERGIPEVARPSFISRMLDCITQYNFIACTTNIGWPILKKQVPLLPDLSSLSNLFPELPGISQNPAPIPGIPDINIPGIQFPSISQIAGGIPQLPQLPLLSLKVGERAGEIKPNPLQETQDGKPKETPATTPSVDNEGIVPGYAGQPPGILLGVSSEKVLLRGNVNRETEKPDAKQPPETKARKRRSTIDIPNTYYDTEEVSDSFSSAPLMLSNITESEYLQLLIRIKEHARLSTSTDPKSKKYFVDTLNSTIRNSLTADQYEILKIVEDLDDQQTSKGIVTQVVQCITSLSFIRCLGVFVWPLITNNLPSLIGLPSFPSFGFFGRSMESESQVEVFLGMSTNEFERELLERKESIESFLLDWYRKLVDEKFQMNLGPLKIKSYGNNELGISFSGFREGRGAKLKDNKNLPSILTIISDIMEEVLDQRPDGEKTKKEKEKKERRSIDDSRETDIQFLKDSEEYVDIKRSMNDDEIITMFLDKIKSNDSEVENENMQYYSSEDAYNAFGVLFGTKLHDKLTTKVESLDHPSKSFEGGSIIPVESSKDVDIVSLESQKDSDDLKVLPLNSQVAYDFEREPSRDQEERQRQKRARNFFKSFLEKHPDKYLKDSNADSIENIEDNKIVEEEYEKDTTRSGLVVQLPRLEDEIISKKVTNSMIDLGRAFKTKMTEMMPGFGLVLSFLLQMALAHARATASIAGMISNMALGSAMFGLMRDTLFGSNTHPKIKYVYDNDKSGPGITWPSQYESGSYYYG